MRWPSAGAPVGRDVPPLQHVAFGELLARVQHDLPARQAGVEEQERQHVLQLVAEAKGAAALVRAGAAPEARGEHLVGQPMVDQPIEGGLVGLDPDGAEALRPPGARGASSAARAAAGSRRCEAAIRASSRGCRLPEHDGDVAVAAGRHLDLAREAATRRPSSSRDPSGRPVSTMTGLVRSRPGEPRKRVRTVSVAAAVRLVAAKAQPVGSRSSDW